MGSKTQITQPNDHKAYSRHNASDEILERRPKRELGIALEWPCSDLLHEMLLWRPQRLIKNLVLGSMFGSKNGAKNVVLLVLG